MANPATPPLARTKVCARCKAPVHLLVEGTWLCIDCDSLLPNTRDEVTPMVENRGNTNAYSSGTEGRPLPSALDGAAYRTPHTQRPPRPTGLDWSHLRAPDSTTTTALEQHLREHVSEQIDQLLLEESTPTPQPPQRPTVSEPDFPPYIVDLAVVMRDSEGHPDPAVRTARKEAANAFVALNKALSGASLAATAPKRPGQRRRLTTADVVEICRRYAAGESTTELGAAFNTSGNTIAKKLRDAGVHLRPRGGQRRAS